jgi:hypothetical protein
LKRRVPPLFASIARAATRRDCCPTKPRVKCRS